MLSDMVTTRFPTHSELTDFAEITESGWKAKTDMISFVVEKNGTLRFSQSPKRSPQHNVVLRVVKHLYGYQIKLTIYFLSSLADPKKSVKLI